MVSGPFDMELATGVRGALVSCNFSVALDVDDPDTSAGRASHSGIGGRKGDAK